MTPHNSGATPTEAWHLLKQSSFKAVLTHRVVSGLRLQLSLEVEEAFTSHTAAAFCLEAAEGQRGPEQQRAGDQAVTWVPSHWYLLPPTNAKVCSGLVQEETIHKFHTSGNSRFTQAVRKYIQHSTQICFIKKPAIKFLGIHHFNFESCNILLVRNNTVSHIYIIILYITKIAMLDY